MLLGSQLQVTATQQYLLYTRYLHSSSALLHTLMYLGLLIEVVGFALSPLLLYVVAEAGQVVTVSQYRKLIESRTGSCLEATAASLCAFSLAYFLPSFMYMALGLSERPASLSYLDLIYFLGTVGTVMWLRCCSKGQTLGRITLTAVVHSWVQTLGKRVLVNYMHTGEVDLHLLAVAAVVLVCDFTVAGRIVGRHTDEVMALYTYYLLSFLCLSLCFPILHASPSPPHSISFLILALVLALSVSAYTGSRLESV